MKLKLSIFIATLLSLFSCSCNQAQKDKKEKTHHYVFIAREFGH